MQPGTVFFTGLLIIIFFILYVVLGLSVALWRMFSAQRRLKFKPFAIFFLLISFLLSYVAVTNSIGWTSTLNQTNTETGFWRFVIKAVILVIFGSISALISFFAFLTLQIISSILLVRIFSKHKYHHKKDRDEEKFIEGEIVE